MVSIWLSHITLERNKSVDLVPRLVIDCSHGATNESVDNSQPVNDLTSARSETDSMDGLEDRRRSSPPRLRRRRRKRHVTGMKMARSIPSQLSRRPESLLVDKDELSSAYEDEVIGQATRKQNGVGEAGSYAVEDHKENGYAPQIDQGPTEADPPQNEDLIRENGTPEAGPSSAPDSERSKLEGQVVAEALTISRLPWWIIGTAITFPALAIIFARSAPPAYSRWIYRAVQRVIVAVSVFLAWIYRYIQYMSREMWDRRDLVAGAVPDFKRVYGRLADYVVTQFRALKGA